MSSSPPPDDSPDERIAERDSKLNWPALEGAMHRDTAARGLAAYRVAGAPLDGGELRAAALELARGARHVGIVTGFCAVLPDRVTAETDGPPGALFLASALESLSIRATIITDRYALPLVEKGCARVGLDRGSVVAFPFDGAGEDGADDTTTDRWIEAFLSAGRGRGLSHLVAIERPGPSHTPESLIAQSRAAAAPQARFEDAVPAEHRDACHDMRGRIIDGYTARTHRLFEVIEERKLPIRTIGIGDGGNEIGMGKFPWERIVEAIGGEPAGRIVCRVATDFALIAGVSNWGGYALALAAGMLRGPLPANRWLEPPGQRALIETLVEAGAVDGRTLRSEPTVDGLDPGASVQPLAAMHAIVADGLRRPS